MEEVTRGAGQAVRSSVGRLEPFEEQGLAGRSGSAGERFRGPLTALNGVLLILFGCIWAGKLWVAFHKQLTFDDAYMFYRYAMNIRHGLGVSWNLDGVHTYGMTSPMWGLVVLLLSFLPVGMARVLVLGSWMSALLGLVALSWAVARNARSGYFASVWRVFPLVAFPLVVTGTFTRNAFTGMETMLGMLCCGIYVGAVLGWQRGVVRAELAGLAGLALFLTRPEGALAVLLLPVLCCVLMPRPGLRDGLVRLLGVFGMGVLLELLACKLYFHTALPLSLYMKGKHAYLGYYVDTRQATYGRGMLASCKLYLLALVVWLRRSEWRLVVCCVAPALLTFAYLLTVTQIMGFDARYYAPYYALIVVPVLLVLDRRIEAGEVGLPLRERPGQIALRVAGVAVVLFVATGTRLNPLLEATDRRLAGKPWVYDSAVLEVAARQPLPDVTSWHLYQAMGDVMVGPLPRGATVAATEVGYLGAIAPQVNVIDLAGLNDTEIALHGFGMDGLLARKPDLIWMPHLDYTYQRGVMFSDPAFLEQYEILAGAAVYGLAIRKDSPIRGTLEAEVQKLWDDLYPGYKESDYLVRSAHWAGTQHRATRK